MAPWDDFRADGFVGAGYSMGVDAAEHEGVTHDGGVASKSEIASTAPSAVVYEELRRKILNREIPPATRINVHAMAREFGVSPTPVREALRVLQGDKLITSPSHRGYATTDVMSADDISDLFEFRLVLEPWAASAVSTNRLGNPGSELLASVELFEPLVDSSTIRDQLIVHDTQFHNLLTAATRNAAAIESMSNLHFHLHLFRIGDFELDPRGTLAEHTKIALAIAAHDADGAAVAMREHLLAAHRRFLVNFPGARGVSLARQRAAQVQAKFTV